jgi:hypothetical protein
MMPVVALTEVAGPSLGPRTRADLTEPYYE